MPDTTNDAQPEREPGEEHPVLKHCNELHDLGFKAGWDGAVEECAKMVDSYGAAVDFIAANVRALASQPPAAPVETVLEECEDLQGRTVQTVRLADGTEVVRILPRSSAGTEGMQWWEEELTKHWGSGDSSNYTRRAANVALQEISRLRALIPAEPQEAPDKARLRAALGEIASIGRKITDPKNTYGLQMANIADAALAVSRPNRQEVRDWEKVHSMLVADAAEIEKAEVSSTDYEHGYNDGVEWAQTHGRSSADTADLVKMLDLHVDGVRHYLHLQIGKPLSKDLISAPEIALDNLHREVKAAIQSRDVPQESCKTEGAK